MPDDSKVLVPYNVLNTSSDQVTPLLYAGSGLTSIETNRAAAERAAHEFPQTPRLPISKPEPSVSIEGLNVPQVLDKRVSTSADPLELVWQAWQDKYEQAKTFIEQGYNEQNIDIQRDLITELKQAKEAITNIPAGLSSPVDAVIADANSKSKGWIDELAKSDRANAYQLARHIDGSLKAVTEALKAFKHDQNLDLDSWKERVSAGYKQKHGLTQDTENLRHHMTLRRHAVRNRLQDVRHELESSKNKIQRKGWRNTFKREAEVKAYFDQVMNVLQVVIRDLKSKETKFDPSLKDSAASMFISKAGQSKEEKRQRGEHEQDKESESINLADVELAMGEQILKFEKAAIKAGKSTKNKMAKVAMQVARTPTYVAPTALHLLHKARSPMAKGVNKALNRNLSDEDQIIRSIVRSLCWTLIQPAFRMQYDYAPLLGAAQSLAKSKHSTTDSADVLETVTEGSAATSGINKAASAQSEEVSGEAEKSRQEVLEPSLKKAEQASESLLAQVSLGGNGALKDVLKHYPLSDLTQLLEQLQSLSLSEKTPDTKIRPSLGKDVQTLKSLLAQAPSNRGAELNQVSASERQRLVNILATIKDMGLSEQRFKDTVAYFLGIGQEVLSEQGQKSLGETVVKIEHALRKGEAYQKLRVQALRLRARATKASEYKDSSLDSLIHKARFAGLAARDAYDELDSLALKHTGQPLGPFSRRSRVAKDWGMCANEVLRDAGHTQAALIPNSEVIRDVLTERNMLTGLVSVKDPLGIFFSTRIAGEWRYAYRGETIKPMSPAEYAAQEKTLAEFIVSWSQKRLARGVIVSFIEGGVDVVGGLTVTPIKIGIRAGIKVPISLIRIGYDVHKIKQGVMPGEDKPYKVIKARITHRLEQLGFKMLMIPVGNTVKTVFAAGVSAAAHAHNAMVEKEEDKVKISSWAKVLGTEALLTGGSVPVSLGAKTAADLVMEPSPKLTTEEQQVVEQIKQALTGESEPQEVNALDESSPISDDYPDINRGQGEYKEAVDKSLAKIARTSFGRHLIESMNEQGIEITMPSDHTNTSDGDHDHDPSVGNYANPDNDTIFFDPHYKPSTEDIKGRPWLDCDPSVVLFHEMLHLYYSENPIQFEVSGQTYQFGGKGDPISEHMVAGADYVNEQKVEFRFSDPEWVKQHLKMGNYVNENDLRRALSQPIRKDYYFDARHTGAEQARYFNPSSPVEEEPTLDVAEPEFKDKIRPYNQIISEHREPNITLETGSSDESYSARQLIHSFCNAPDGFQLGLPKLLNLIDSGRFSEGVSNLVREWAAEYQAGYGIDRNILEKVLKDKGYAGLTDHAIVVSDDQNSVYVSSLDKIMASTHLRSGYLSGFTEGTGAISIAELQDIYKQYQSMSRLIGSTFEHFRNNTDRTSASVQLYRDPIEYISEGAVWPNLNTFSAVLEPDDERAFKSTLQKMDALEQALRLLYKEILGVEPAYKLGVESREDLAQQLDSFGEPGSEFIDEHPEYLNYRLTWRKIEALGGDIADYLASPSHLNWPMAEDGIGEDATELASSYRSMPTDAKQELYSNAVEYVLFQIGRDNLLSQGTRDAAYNARLKNEPCVVVDSTKPNSFFLPDSPGAKSGLYIDLNKPGQPYQRKANLTYQPSDLVSLNTLSQQLVTITDSHANNDEEVADLIQHVLPKSILGAQVPDLGVSAEQVQLELEYTFATSSFSEYLRSISRPFASLASQTQLMIDDGNGVTLQQTEKNQQQAEYIGAWIDTGIGVVTLFIPQGRVLNAAQSWAGIAADVADGKDPDPVDLAGAILGSIPGSRAGAQIDKFSKTGGQGVRVLLKVGEETVDLIDFGRGVKQACESGDPLDLFNVLLTTGMKAQDVIERAHQIKPDLADADIPKQNQWLIENGVDNGWGSSRPPLGVEGNPPVPGTTGRSLYGQAVPFRRPELDGGEWTGQSGTLPGTDADYFAYINAGGTPEGYYATLKEAEPAVTQSLFSFFGKQYQGRVQDGQFEVKKVGSDEWRAGHWWEEFTWRFKNRGGRVQSSAELDKRILKAAAKDTGFNFLCNLSAINTAQASGELPKGVATSLQSTKFNSPVYKQAFSLPASVMEPSGSSLVEGPLSKESITESGFIHTGVKDEDGNVHYEHVIYAYVQDGEVTLYQSNSNTFYEAFGGDIQQPSNNRVGQSSLTKIEWSEKTDTKLAEEQRTNPNLVYSFTPTNQVKNVADISVQQNGDVEVSAGEQTEVFSVGNNAQEIARIPFMNEGRRVEVRGYTSEFQGKAGQEALSIHGDRQGNFYLARQGHPMTAQQLVDYLKSQGVDLKSGSGPVHLLSCYSKSSGAAQALADVINRPVIGYSNREVQLPTLQQLTQNPVQIGSKMGKFDPRRFLAQSDFKPATPRVYHPRSDSSQGGSTSGRASLEMAGSGSGSNAKQMAFNALPQMQASPSWYSAENIYTPKTSAHGVIFKDPDNPDRLIKFYKRPSDKGIAENNRDVMNRLYGQDAELITLTGPDGQRYYAVNMPKMEGVSIEDIKDPQVMQDMLEKIEEGDFIAHWAGKLQDNGIRVEDLNLGSVLYDPSTGRFSLVDFDSSTISDSVSNAHYKQMYRSLHTPIRDVLIRQAKTLFAGQQDKLDLVNRVEGKLSQRFRHLMELDERGEASFSTLMEERTPAEVEVAVGARNQETASAGHADEPIQLSQGDWDSIPNKMEMFGADSEYFYEDFDGQIYKYEAADGEITYLGKQDGEYINLKNDQTWQPRHYNVAGQNAIKTWLTGDPATLYADTDRVIADRSASYDNERLENIRNGFDQGHYLPPIDVRWDNGVFKVINGNHRLKVAIEMGMESIPYRLIR